MINYIIALIQTKGLGKVTSNFRHATIYIPTWYVLNA